MSITPTGTGYSSTSGASTPSVSPRPVANTGASFTLVQEAKPASNQPAPTSQSPSGNAPRANKGRGQLVNILV